MPTVSEAQRKFLNWKKGHRWVKRHGFDNKGPLPEHVHEKKARRYAAALARYAAVPMKPPLPGSAQPLRKPMKPPSGKPPVPGLAPGMSPPRPKVRPRTPEQRTADEEMLATTGGFGPKTGTMAPTTDRYGMMSRGQLAMIAQTILAHGKKRVPAGAAQKFAAGVKQVARAEAVRRIG